MLNINDIIIDRNQPEYRLIDVRIIVAESKLVNVCGFVVKRGNRDNGMNLILSHLYGIDRIRRTRLS